MQYVGIKDHDGTVAGVDDISGYLVQISEIHAQIHEGQFFTSTVVDTSVADSGTLEILMLTNGSVPHARFTAQSGGNSRLEIFEDTTVSANGSALVAQNRNRLSANTATALVYSGPTVTGDGTKIFDMICAGGTGGNSAGGSGGMYEELILKASTLYLVRLTNLGGNSQPCGLIADWYEL